MGYEERRWGWKWMMLGIRKRRRRMRKSAWTGSNREGEVGGGFILGRGAAVDGGRHDVCFHGDGLSVSHT